MTPDTLRDEILRLPPEDRFELLSEVWDSIAADPDSVPVPEWHRTVLRERLAESDPEHVTWSAAQRRLRENG